MVYEEGKTITSSAKICKMNESTAKMTVKAFKDRYFKQHGHYPKKNDLKNQPLRGQGRSSVNNTN